ncbi:TPA: DUF6367 family protein [Acinetobacter baumannii]|uniref:Uncharacterized protein n=15 Tax=Acinetobacter baumannii TaxID=470 RepID=A0A1L2ZXU0_ACIBA|nr:MULTISPECIES: DUF6367 family protein [Acinetobacter]AHX27649.1 hypothetical protein A478_03475 [Acinetobacter baumannii AC12]AHX65274.1 hypothetical protein B856_08290 [Acinetobacter baumannii AC30]ELG5222518.1 hypothetical protein [Escherichia coli]EXB07995.1 hypothetical protein J513_3763 [Acinetobacter baumannii 1397084]EXC95283.1 hypothetical protein J484_1344 [Acinetobacter baumannii 1051830]EXD24477.1 hypothetical protein J480_1668 [Acinetobacter baumannii 34654]EYD05944.1 hypotheti
MMQPTHTHSTLQYIHISVPEILLSNIQIKNSWQDYNQEWSYRLDPPHASHPFQRDLYIIKSKNIETEDIKKILDNIVVKNSKNKDDLKNIVEAETVIKEILDLSNYIPIENWLNDTGNRSIVESMIDKNKVKLLDII